MKIKLPKDDMIDVEEPVVKEPRVRKTRKMKKFNMSGGVRKDPKSDAPRAIQRRRKQRRAENSRFTGSTPALAARYLGFVAILIVVTSLNHAMIGDPMNIPAIVIVFIAAMILIFQIFLLSIIQYLITNIVISGNRFEFFGGLLGLIGTQVKVFLIGIILLPILTAIMLDMSITSIPLIVIVYWLYGIWGALEMVRWIVSNTILVR